MARVLAVLVGQALSVMPHSFPVLGFCGCRVGQTPGRRRTPSSRCSVEVSSICRTELGRPGGRTRASAPQLLQVSPTKRRDRKGALRSERLDFRVMQSYEIQIRDRKYETSLLPPPVSG